MEIDPMPLISEYYFTQDDAVIVTTYIYKFPLNSPSITITYSNKFALQR